VLRLVEAKEFSEEEERGCGVRGSGGGVGGGFRIGIGVGGIGTGVWERALYGVVDEFGNPVLDGPTLWGDGDVASTVGIEGEDHGRLEAAAGGMEAGDVTPIVGLGDGLAVHGHQVVRTFIWRGPPELAPAAGLDSKAWMASRRSWLWGGGLPAAVWRSMSQLLTNDERRGTLQEPKRLGRRANV
jgi:hypothetical protein